MADDWSWGIIPGATPSTAWQNFYVWDGHGSISNGAGYGSGAARGCGFAGDVSSGIIDWQIVNLDTLVAITSPTCGIVYGNNQRGNVVNNMGLCSFWESIGGIIHVYLDTDATNHIRARNGDGTILGTSDFILPSSAPDGSGPTYNIETIVTVDSTVGTVDCWVNDIQVLQLTGKNTRHGGSGVVGSVRLQATGGRRICELIVHDGSARLGSQWRVGYVPVATDGTYSNGTAVGAATFLQAVDDTPASPEAESTSYGVLDASGTPKKASFQSGAVPATWLQIRDVHPQAVIEKSDGGTNTAKIGLKSGATEVLTTSAFGVADAWEARRLAFRTNPAAGTPLWTVLSAEASEVVIDRIT